MSDDDSRPLDRGERRMLEALARDWSGRPMSEARQIIIGLIVAFLAVIVIGVALIISAHG